MEILRDLSASRKIIQEEAVVNRDTRFGRIKLSDGTIIKLVVFIIDVKEVGFSPFGGVSFDVKIVGGVSTESVPEDVKKLVIDKPLFPPEPPREGWGLLDIIEL